jgi:ectoine hydroxylase-related dioxygenase (phytanoyl-CoA dioxygenase family)
LFSAPTLWLWAGKLLDCASEAVVFHLSNLTRKPAGNGPAIVWHRDARNTYCAAADHRTLRFLLPLQPMSAVNGGTEIVAGSHLPGAAQTADDTHLICCPPVSPGDCLALHSEVLHGGAPNRGTSERDVIVIQFGVAGSTLTPWGR